MHFGTRIYNSILVVIQLRIVISVLLNESSQPLYPPCFNATLCSYALNLCPISCVGSDDIILIMVSLHKIRQRRSLSESSPLDIASRHVCKRGPQILLPYMSCRASLPTCMQDAEENISRCRSPTYVCLQSSASVGPDLHKLSGVSRSRRNTVGGFFSF